MLRKIARNRPGVFGGALVYLLFVAFQLLAPPEWFSIIRERGFDAVLWGDQRFRKVRQGKPSVVVVDIDRRTLAALGNWPWPRATMARLVGIVAAAKPDALGIDVLFSGPDPRSPAIATREPAGAAPGASPADGDQRLAAAIGSAPTALGSTLEMASGQIAPTVTVLRRGPIALDDIWRGPGANEPLSSLLERAAGNGVVSLPGDADGKVRRVPLLVGVGTTLRPGLAVETVRLTQHAATLIVESDPQRLVIGNLNVALPRDGFLRLVPVLPELEAARTISAIDVIEDQSRRAALAGAIALIGGSAPELGGLRETPGDPLKPSVQIEANTIDQIVSQRAPVAARGEIQFLLAFILSAIVLVVAVTASPLAGVFIAAAAIATLWAGAIGLSLSFDRLVDPLIPTIGAAATFVTGSLGSFIMVSRREARIRDRFAQHLAPEVVKRIAENPDMLKLRAEKRELTALFTDIEGFTAMTHRAGPEQLVAELDGYIEGVATIVMEHGGMVDKIVGDAVHAFFNAPVDLANHAARAVKCATVIRSWTEQYRLRPSALLIGLGRTRIGIETGEAIVGDIGIRSKLDYTAHGDAINSAARLEAMNKELGSAICVGPTAAGYCDPSTLRPLGTVALRGLEAPIAVFEPWPAEAAPEWRARYLAAAACMGTDPVRAAEMFEMLAVEAPSDPVPSYLARRLRGQATDA
jgi:adenylate cyclase